METLLKQRNEKLKTREFQHHLLPIGGRIKAAGISMGLLYNEELFPFYRDKTPKAALKTTRSFK